MQNIGNLFPETLRNLFKTEAALKKEAELKEAALKRKAELKLKRLRRKTLDNIELQVSKARAEGKTRETEIAALLLECFNSSLHQLHQLKEAEHTAKFLKSFAAQIHPDKIENS